MNNAIILIWLVNSLTCGDNSKFTSCLVKYNSVCICLCTVSNYYDPGGITYLVMVIGVEWSTIIAEGVLN